MDYKEKVIALLNSKELSQEQKEKLEEIFPELKKESEDDDMRKEIINFLKHYPNIIVKKERRNDWVTWLEKKNQGEHEAVPVWMPKFLDELRSKKNYFDYDEHRDIEGRILAIINWMNQISFNEKDGKQKQGEQKPYGLAWLKKQGESKFHEDDWIISDKDNTVHQIKAVIKNVSNGRYAYDLIDGGYISTLQESYYHLWTIQDAKDGDVLTTDDGDIFVFDGTVEEDKYPFAYYGLTRRRFESYDRRLPFTHNNVHPATKEQCDFLFRKMKEAGYEWDADKKELKKVEQKDFVSKEVIPRYNIGDVLCDKSCTTLDKEEQPNFEIIDIRNGMYICDKGSFPISQQDEYELVAKRIEQKSWSEEDNIILNEILSVIPYHLTSESYKKFTNWLKSLKDRVQPQLQIQQEWNKDDENELSRVIYMMEQLDLTESWSDCYNWLTSLKDRVQPQPKQEWSEDDELMLTSIIQTLKLTNGAAQMKIDWLKSLRPQKRWQPSDEQMKFLWKYAEQNNYDGSILTSLYNDLKKL